MLPRVDPSMPHQALQLARLVDFSATAPRVWACGPCKLLTTAGSADLSQAHLPADAISIAGCLKWSSPAAVAARVARRSG